MIGKFLGLVLGFGLVLSDRRVVRDVFVSCEGKSAEELNVVDYKVDSIPLEYVPGTGYVVKAEVGGQELKLLLNSNTCGLMLFENSEKVCFKAGKHDCYDPQRSRTARWCDNSAICVPGKSNFQCSEVSSPQGIRDFTATPVRVNSEFFKIFSIEGFESLRLGVDHKLSGYSFDRVCVKLARSLDRYDYRIFSGVDGLFGIAGSDMCCRKNFWDLISRDYAGFFVLDINPPAYLRFPSKLYLGSDRVADEEVVWSERRQTGGIFTNSLLQFTIYDLKMCNVSLFGRTSSNWEAIIDLTTPYLVLPKNFWITLMTYLPVDQSCFTENKRPRLCKLTNGNRYFPTLEFKLSQSYYLNFEKVEPPTLKIPLENLLQDDGDHKTILIIPDETRDKSSFTLNPSIKFGYKVLESLNVVVDSWGYRVGLVNKNQLVGSMSKCAEVVQCIGDQVYEPALNVCLNPLCSIWLMKRLNPETGICETSFIAKVLLTGIISALIIAEFYCNFARKHILKITSRLCQ